MNPFLWKLGAVAIIAFGIAAGAYWKGRSEGKIEQLEDSVQAYERRENIDAEVQAATRYELCISLGGLPDQCSELRGLDQTPEGE